MYLILWRYLPQISKQLVEQTNCLHKDLFDDLRHVANVHLNSGAMTVPYLQKAATQGLKCAVAK